MTDVNGVLVYVPPPPGYVVDFNNPQQQAATPTYWLAGVGLILAMLFTAQRLYVKLFIEKRFQLDDWLLVLTWMTSIVTQFLITYMFGSHIGGVHAWEISIYNYNKFLLAMWVTSYVYVLSGSFAKIALLVFYLRLSPQRWFRISVWSTLVFVGVYTIIIFFNLVFACNPIEKSFNVFITTGYCINSTALYIATAAMNIISDIILFILPIPMVVKLQVPVKQKFGLMFIFGIGSITIVTSITRDMILPILLTSNDLTWEIAYACLIIVIEANLIVICGMLPTLRKFFRHVAPKLIGENSQQRSRNTKSGTPQYKHNEFSGRSGLVTSGSMSKKIRLGIGGGGGGGGGYAEFGRGVDTYDLALDTVSVANSGARETAVVSADALGGLADEPAKARGSPWGGVAASLGTYSYTAASRQSKVPAAASDLGPGISRTTRIEVWYEDDKDLKAV